MVAAEVGNRREAVDAICNSSPDLRRLGLTRGDRSAIIPVEAIDCIEAQRKYVRIWSGGRSHLLRRPISLMATPLDPSLFVQVSRSAIVNIERIREIIQPAPRDMYVALQGDVRIKVTGDSRTS